MTDEDPIRRAARWKAFYEEPGGIRDMLGTMRAAHFAKMSEAEPWQVFILANMAISAKAVEELNTAVLSVIGDGQQAKAAQAHADKIAAIPDYKRRWATGG